MLVCISPAKALDWSDRPNVQATQPAFGTQAFDLAQTAKALDVGDIKKLMKLSDKLAQLNYDRFQTYAQTPAPDATRPAAFAFNGDTYQGLDVSSLDEDDMHYAQSHLRILSGLYGVLRPLDAIQPYRLEMGSRLKNPRGANLYAYWGDQIAKALNAQANEIGTDVLVNCASQEYFGAVDQKALTPNVITPQFLEIKDGKPKTISFYAKRARGAMARYIVQHRVVTMDDLCKFDTGGYAYDPDLSQDGKPAFVRDYPAK
ncbi:MAG: peroxide stress protein YaaA [Planktomarina sp.]